MKKQLTFDLQLFAPLVNADLDKTDIQLQEDMKVAIESGDSKAFVMAQVAMSKGIEARILKEAKQAVNDDFSDQSVMIKRGLNPLTMAETKYYNEVIGTTGFAGTEALMPATVFERVFEDLVANHALLSEINFINTTATTEFISRNNDAAAAWWGPLTDKITKELSQAFKKEKTDLFKLSAFIPVCKSMLDLGPVWIDRFVRAILTESMSIALELAIIAGTGKTQPIGMIKDLAGAVVEGVYPNKAGVALNDLTPGTLGKLVMSPLTKEGKRSVPSVLMVVNPLDYWGKIFPNTTVLTNMGTYVYGVLPIPAKVIQSVAVPQGTMIAGMAKDYFMGVGSTQKIEFSDQYRFLEDERVYLAKQYGNGKPMDNVSFLVLDISKMTVPAAPTI